MQNHKIIYPALQKYYSALKALNEFGVNNDIFDDISNLDIFFSEFRNITFMIQKGIESDEQLNLYRLLRDEHLLNNELKWFIDIRNKTTKEVPFELKKELKIKLYTTKGVMEISDQSLVIDYQESFEIALNFLRKMMSDFHIENEIHFSIEILFTEFGLSVDIYPKILFGINQMNIFLNEFSKVYPCTCANCELLNSKIEILIRDVLSKKVRFVNDYSLGKELIEGEKVEMYVSNSNDSLTHISNLRSTLENSIYQGLNLNLFDLFKKFITLHITIFNLSQGNILPNFMIIYSDNSFRKIVFVATTKATLYRKVQDIVELNDFQEIIAIFTCGEFYTFNLEDQVELNKMASNERAILAKSEILSFSMLDVDGNEMTIFFDEKEITDNNYVITTIKNAKFNNDNVFTRLFWLNPVREKMKK